MTTILHREAFLQNAFPWRFAVPDAAGEAHRTP